MDETTVSDLSAGLGSGVVAVSFWVAIAILGFSGLLALSKVSWNRITDPRPPGGGPRVLAIGLVTAFLIVSMPRLTTIGSGLAGGVVGGGEGGGAQRPGVMEYFAGLSTGSLWAASANVAVWVIAVVATLAVGLARRGSTAE